MHGFLKSNFGVTALIQMNLNKFQIKIILTLLCIFHKHLLKQLGIYSLSKYYKKQEAKKEFYLKESLEKQSDLETVIKRICK